MLAGLIACLLPLSQALAYSQIFQSNDEDFAYDPYYVWRSRKDQRNADVEAYLRQVILQHQPLRRQTDLWPPEPFHHQHGPSSSDFAVPPTDERFFDPPPRLVAPHLYYRETAVGEGKQRDDEAITEKTSTTSELEEAETIEEVVRTPLVDFAPAQDNILLVAVIAGSGSAAFVGIALLIYGIVRLQKRAKDAADVEYPAYGVTGPNKEATPTGDRRLAHSAQMYHYQLTKQQIIAMESSGRGERRGSVSEADSEDDDNEEGDYTVYECPGLAPTGEMEVKNPLFQDETTPANNDQSKE